VYSVMNIGAPTTARSVSATRPELIALAAILRIPVAMHNVDEERIFRPAPGAPSASATPKARLPSLRRLRPLYGRR